MPDRMAINLGAIGIYGPDAKQDLWGTMERLAAMGYRGIEGGEALLEGDVAANVHRLHDLGLRVLTTSSVRETLRDDLDGLVARTHALQSSRVSMWWAPCESREQIQRDCELYNTAGARLKAEGLTLCYHNHDHEFRTSFDGVTAWDLLLAGTDPSAVAFEPDIMWITFGGGDPVSVLSRMGGRAPAIHLKDVAAVGTPEPLFTALGTGVVRVVESIAAAKEAGAEWFVVEQDRLRNLTAMETLSLSALYLKEHGLLL